MKSCEDLCLVLENRTVSYCRVLFFVVIKFKFTKFISIMLMTENNSTITISQNSTWLFMSRLDTARHVRRVERVNTISEIVVITCL